MICVCFWICNQEITFKSVDEFIFVFVCKIIFFFVLSYILVVAFQILKRNPNFCICFQFFWEIVCTLYKPGSSENFLKLRIFWKIMGILGTFPKSEVYIMFYTINTIVKYFIGHTLI